MILTDYMGSNTPKDYLGYNNDDTALTYSTKLSSSKATVLANAPCYNAATDSQATADQCYQTMMRLAYLNQQSDLGSLTLRANKPCLTQTELDEIRNQDVQHYHPLNCAKMNAKPYPYFDGGVMFMKKSGWFSFFSSRNNNHSNRQQIGVVCVGASCQVDPKTNVLQDTNPQTNGKSVIANAAASRCFDTASGSNGANSNGAHSCLPATGTVSASVIVGETKATQEGDNDSKGDGNAQGCAVLSFSDELSNSVEEQLTLAFVLLAVGLFTSWLAYYLYNRYQARKAGDSKFRYETAWQKDTELEKKARPASIALRNPGVKMSRLESFDSISTKKSPRSPSKSPAKLPKPVRAPKPAASAPRRQEMI